MNEEIKKYLEEKAIPLADWLRENFDNKTEIVITVDGAELIKKETSCVSKKSPSWAALKTKG